MKRHIALLTVILLVISGFAGILNVEAGKMELPFEVERFADVPENHWAYEPVHYFRYLNIAQGIGGNRFGLGQPVKKSEFVTMLVRLMGWELVETDNCSFADVSKDKWYHSYVETAVANGAVVKETDIFNPDKPITRLEIAEAIVRALGYGELAGQLKFLPSEFADVTEGAEYTNMLKDFGISGGAGGANYMPDSTAKKEEAAAMLVRMYQRLNSKVSELHAFYAIKSYDQMNLMQDLDSVTFGWSRLEYDEDSGRFSVATKKSGDSDFFIPEGYSEPVNFARLNNLPIQLNLFASNEIKVTDASTGEKVGMVERLLADSYAQSEVISQVVKLLGNTESGNDAIAFDGIVIDFENLRGEKQKNLFNEFLKKLSTELGKISKKLYVAVHPRRGNGQAYYDGYDYRTIGEIADRVILMAHDYNAVSLTDSEMAIGYSDTPLTPIYEIYYALKAVTDRDTGVQEPGKVWLQISFDTVQWKLSEGKVINRNAYRPTYVQIKDRLTKNEAGSELAARYSEKLQNPWLKYYNNSDGTDNIIWYEDSRSVLAKIKLAKMFGINGISLWRLGNIPDFEDTGSNEIYLDVWQEIQNQ